jgi:predicted ABC-type ATPase
MNNLKRALAELANVIVYDHSDLDIGYRLVAIKENGAEIALNKPTPEWLKALLP